MALLKKLDIGKSLGLAGVITVSIALMAWLINVLNLSVSIKPLFAIGSLPIDPYSPFTSTVGNKVIAFLAGIIPQGGSLFNIPSLVTIFVSAFLIVWVGYFIAGILPVPTLFKGRMARANGVFWTVVYGTIAFYLLIAGFNMAPWGVIGGFALYAAVVSVVATWMAPILGIEI